MGATRKVNQHITRINLRAPFGTCRTHRPCVKSFDFMASFEKWHKVRADKTSRTSNQNFHDL